MQKIQSILLVAIFLVLFVLPNNTTFAFSNIAIASIEQSNSPIKNFENGQKNIEYFFDRFLSHSITSMDGMEEEEEIEETSRSRRQKSQNNFKNFLSHSGMIYIWDYNGSQNFYSFFNSSQEFNKLYALKETIVLLI